VLGLILGVIAYRRELARRARYMAKAEMHMDRMEAKSDKMIALLKSIEQALRDSTQH
jgi:hypothetical protein